VTSRNPFSSWTDRAAVALLALACAVGLLPRRTKLVATSPLQAVLLAPLRAGAEIRTRLTGLRAENARLARAAAELAVDNARLLAMVGARESIPSSSYPLVRASIIARDMATFQRYLVVVPQESGRVRPGEPALASAGVVGRCIASSGHQALVQTIHAPDCRVTVQSLRSRVPGLTRPEAGGMLLVDYVPKDADVVVNDTIITAGLGGVFPKGLRVGTVVSVPDRPGSMFKTILLRPFVDVTTVQEVFVLLLPDTTGLGARDRWMENVRPLEVGIPEEEGPR
jgi:rod shape-determining protein MreC